MDIRNNSKLQNLFKLENIGLNNNIFKEATREMCKIDNCENVSNILVFCSKVLRKTLILIVWHGVTFIPEIFWRRVSLLVF